jgi:glycosyltransferase involved in cell wall biosynthesis
MTADILTVIILTRDEERNLRKCLESIRPAAERIVVVDSLSSDCTVEIAKSMGATILQRAWTHHADQFNWGMDTAGIDTPWTMRIDADEEMTPSLARALPEFLRGLGADVSGVHVRRRVYFMDKWIRHGGFYPTWLLRVWRTGVGRCEARLMDEHVVLAAGRSVRLYEDIIDRNNKDLTFWIGKHNTYATREVQDILAATAPGVAAGSALEAQATGEQDASRRWMKANVYLRLPLFVRPFLYFCYRYFVRLGFLDGVPGLVFHFLQGFWYRFLVDAKLYESRRRASARQG